MQLQQQLDKLMEQKGILKNEPLVEYCRKYYREAVEGGIDLENFVDDVKSLIPESKPKAKVKLVETTNTGKIKGMGDEFSNNSVFELEVSETIGVDDTGNSKKKFMRDIQGI